MPSCVKSLKPEKATHVACGKSHTIVSTLSGKVFSFGSNTDCQLGLGDTEERSIPAEVTGIDSGEDGVRMLAAGCLHSAALTVDGGVYVWGSNSDGQLGLGDSVTVIDVPTRLDIPHTITYISCGYYHTAFVTEEGKLLLCGEGENGKLGLGRQEGNAYTPTGVNLDVPVRLVACGGNHTVAVTMDGDVYGFGSNLSGQLGLGREVLMYSVPECVETLLGKHVCAAACGESHTAFLTVEGHMYTCGDGRHGKLCKDTDPENADDGSVQCLPQFASRFRHYRVTQVACGGCHTMVQAALDIDEVNGMSNGGTGSTQNGDVTLMLNRVEAMAEDNIKSAMEGNNQGANRVLPPLQQTPVLNGVARKHHKSENDAEGMIEDQLKDETETQAQYEETAEEEVSSVKAQAGDLIASSDSAAAYEADKDSESSTDALISSHNGGLDIADLGEDVFHKYNLRDAGDLADEISNHINDLDNTSEKIETPATIKAEDDENDDDHKSSEDPLEDRRCSVDITPTVTVTGTDGVDVDSEDGSIIAVNKTTNNQKNTTPSEKVEGRMAKFLNTFRRKKLSEENVCVSPAWTDVDRRISSDSTLVDAKKPSEKRVRSGQVHKSKACTIL